MAKLDGESSNPRRIWSEPSEHWRDGVEFKYSLNWRQKKVESVDKCLEFLSDCAATTRTTNSDKEANFTCEKRPKNPSGPLEWKKTRKSQWWEIKLNFRVRLFCLLWAHESRLASFLRIPPFSLYCTRNHRDSPWETSRISHLFFWRIRLFRT